VTGQVIEDRTAHLAGCRRLRPADTAGGRLLYLLCSGAIVVPYRARGDSWRCVVLAAADTAAGRHVTVGAEALETALAVPMMDPFARADAATYATSWLARVWHHWPVGQVPELARQLAGQLLGPSRTIDLNPATVRTLVVRQRLRTGALRNAVARLAEAGLLTEARPADGADLGRYTLAMPPLPIDGADAVRCPQRPATADEGGQ